jgi:hypothetical protein
METTTKKITNSKPIPHIPLPFKEVIADVLKVKPEAKPSRPTIEDQHLRDGNRGRKRSDRRPAEARKSRRDRPKS